MKIPRLLSMIHKEFLQILRDPRTLGLTFAMPLMQLLLLGFAATNDVRNVPLAVIDRDRTPASRGLVDAYRNAAYFHIDFDVDSEAELRRLVDNGSAVAGLIIPPGYSALLAAGQTSPVSFVLDGSDPAVAGTALANARAIAQAKSASQQLAAAAEAGQTDPPGGSIEVHTQVWYNPDMVSAF
jgi:ABC-2 type transport system permease protein